METVERVCSLAFSLLYRAVSSDSGNYSCYPSNAEADMVGVHVLEGTDKEYHFLFTSPHPLRLASSTVSPHPGGLPRANVMASSSPTTLLPKQVSLLMILVAFNVRHGWYLF